MEQSGQFSYTKDKLEFFQVRNKPWKIGYRIVQSTIMQQLLVCLLMEYGGLEISLVFMMCPSLRN